MLAVAADGIFDAAPLQTQQPHGTIGRGVACGADAPDAQFALALRRVAAGSSVSDETQIRACIGIDGIPVIALLDPLPLTVATERIGTHAAFGAHETVRTHPARDAGALATDRACIVITCVAVVTLLAGIHRAIAAGAGADSILRTDLATRANITRITGEKAGIVT